MQQSVEIRSLFIDYRLMEFAFSLPTVYKFDLGVTKRIIRDSLKDHLPSKTITRRSDSSLHSSAGSGTLNFKASCLICCAPSLSEQNKSGIIPSSRPDSIGRNGFRNSHSGAY